MAMDVSAQSQRHLTGQNRSHHQKQKKIIFTLCSLLSLDKTHTVHGSFLLSSQRTIFGTSKHVLTTLVPTPSSTQQRHSKRSFLNINANNVKSTKIDSYIDIHDVTKQISNNDSPSSSTASSPSSQTTATTSSTTQPPSFLKELNLYNFPGMPNNRKTLTLSLDPRMVTVTGETGSGKSLLIREALRFVTGGKAKSSLLMRRQTENDYDSEDNNRNEEMRVDITMNLSPHHLSHLPTTLLPSPPPFPSSSPPTTITLSRRLTISPTNKGRLRSTCLFNNTHPITLSTLRLIASPLISIVDPTTVASRYMDQPSWRRRVLDSAVPMEVRRKEWNTRGLYGRVRREREGVEKELGMRVLPLSYTGGDGTEEEEEELLKFWVEELDELERWVMGYIDDLRNCDDLPSATSSSSSSPSTMTPSLGTVYDTLLSASWNDNNSREEIYHALRSVDHHWRQMDVKINNARAAGDVLSSLTNELDKARDYLLSAGVSNESSSSSSLNDSLERTHDMLNDIEQALRRTESSISSDNDDNDSVISQLTTSQSLLFPPSSITTLQSLLDRWHVLSRKHNLSSQPHLLPRCHCDLRQEWDGNVEAQVILPRLKEEEDKARREWMEAREVLGMYRRKVAMEVWERGVDGMLPALGMEDRCFRVAFNDNGKDGGMTTDDDVDDDVIDFHLMRRRPTDNNSPTNATNTPSMLTKKSHDDVPLSSASSGEKARLLLTLETIRPGSTTTTASPTNDNITNNNNTDIPPVTIIYDEIDAHVGGNAAVSIAKMLRSASRQHYQVIVITHSASVAASADQHVVVARGRPRQHGGGDDDKSESWVEVVEGEDRRRELGRMAAGDLVSWGEEMSGFAEALMREGGRGREEEGGGG